MYDYSKLLGKIKEKGLTCADFADKIGVSPPTLSLKLSNKAFFKQNEMKKTSEIIGFDISEIGAYFFCEESSENLNHFEIK